MTHLRLVPSLLSTDVTSDDASADAFRQEFTYICRSLRRLGTASSEIDDLAQEVFLVLHRNWPDYDASRPLRPYLFGIAFRISAAHLRKRRREVPYGALDAEDPAPRPDVALQAKQARALVLAALDRIPLPRRAVLVMHDLDSISMHEVAAVLSIPLFTAYSRLRKARKELARAVRRLMKDSAR